MDWTNEIILQTATDLMADCKTKTKVEIDEKYYVFSEVFPRLFQACTRDSTDRTLDELKKFLKLRDGYASDKIGANVQVGEGLAKKYIYRGAIKEPSKQEKEAALVKILEKEKGEQYNPPEAHAVGEKPPPRTKRV